MTVEQPTTATSTATTATTATDGAPAAAEAGAASDAPTGPDAAGPHRPARLARATVALLPGAGAAAVIAAVATAVGGLAPVVGAPVVAIVLGIVVASVRPLPERFRPGLTFTAKRVLQGSIVLLGLGLSLREVVSTGARSLPVLVGTLVAALGMAWLAGRALRLDRDLTTLVGVGTAICGASAIAATDAVIGAEEADVSYAVATIFTFNVVAVLSFPALGHAIGLSQHSFGLWAGTAVNDVSSVVAAATVYGHPAASYAVVVKLTRTLAIVPIAVVLAEVARRRRPAAVAGVRGEAEELEEAMASASAAVPGPVAAAPPARPGLRRVFPLFILGFLAAVAANSLGLVPAGWHRGLGDLATWMITAALAAIGLSTRVAAIRRAGHRPLLLGAVLWATVALVSLGLQAATGTL